MGTTTLLSLDQKLLEAIGDWKQETVTTAINADKLVVCTDFTLWTARDDYFNDWYIYFEDHANKGVDQLVGDYSTTATTITVLANLLDDTTNLATFRVSRYSWANRKKAINDALREVYPVLYRAMDNRTLLTGNILPNSHFEDWAVTTAPDFYTMQDANITATALTIAGLVRGGAKSMNVVTGAGGAGKYVYITSKTYPRLLDLMGKTIDFKCWAYPEDADDASIQIYTIKADGTTTQTLTSTTSCPATAWTLLELESQTINDDIVEIQFRFKVTTASKYIYFDAARVTGAGRYEYLLPDDFTDGNLSQVHIQAGGYSDDICDDLHPTGWDRVLGYKVIDDGTYKYLRLPSLYSPCRQIRLIGEHALEELTAATNALAAAKTISLSDQRLNLLIEYAAYRLFEIEKSGVSSEDRSNYERESLYHLAKYRSLKGQHGMMRPSGHLNFPAY